MFRDRQDAGQRLAQRLTGFAKLEDVLVLGLPRGGVPVARAVAEALGAAWDLFLVRKLGVPWQPELALGALAEGGVRVIDEALVRACGLTPRDVNELAQKAQAELDRRSAVYRGNRPMADVRGRVVIVVDDGLATGATMLAAVRALRVRGAARIVAAVPVAPPSTCRLLEREADQVVCVESPERFDSVGSWYEDFAQLSDETVRATLRGAGVLQNPDRAN